MWMWYFWIFKIKWSEKTDLAKDTKVSEFPEISKKSEMSDVPVGFSSNFFWCKVNGNLKKTCYSVNFIIFLVSISSNWMLFSCNIGYFIWSLKNYSQKSKPIVNNANINNDR